VSLLDRIIDSLHSLFYSQKRSVSVGSRFIAVTAAIFTLTTVFPTLAEELLPPTEVVQTSIPPVSEESSQDAVEGQPDQPSTGSETPASPAPLTEEEEAKAEEAKVKPASSQPQIKFRFPQSIALDPRASVANLPQLSMTGGSVGLLCLSSNGVIDLSAKGSSNNIAAIEPVKKSDNKNSGTENTNDTQVDRNALQVAGDLTTFVRISGTLNQINELINSAGGLRIYASQGRVVGTSLVASYVELTGSDLSPEFCSKASNQKTIAFRALGLQMDTVKTRVDFNKPSGK
jgi:hypothetical protein